MEIQFRSTFRSTVPLVTNNAVRTPRWNGGGLQIINESEQEERSAGLLIAQLRSALGISNYKVTTFNHFSRTLKEGWFFSNHKYLNNQLHKLNHSQSGIADWELENIIIQRTLHSLSQASSTLKVKLPKEFIMNLLFWGWVDYVPCNL